MIDGKLDIVKLIEKNPITRLSKDYQNRLVDKIKAKFTEKEQQMFVASFFCYLNHSKTEVRNDITIISYKEGDFFKNITTISHSIPM